MHTHGYTCIYRLYIATAVNTMPAPAMNSRLGMKSNMKTDSTALRMMLMLVAKVLRILSAYLTTIATTSPPHACCMTTDATRGVYL